MSLSLGIEGLPNVGKSTLFNALTHNNVVAANYPFATIEPNEGVVSLPDPRLDKLAELFEEEPKKSLGRASLMPSPGGPPGPTMRKAPVRSVPARVR